MLKALFEHWPSAKTPEPEQGNLKASCDMSHDPPCMHTDSLHPAPNMERLVEMCGGEAMKEELWEELGKSLGISDERLEKIALEEKDNLEKCKQCVLNVCCQQCVLNCCKPWVLNILCKQCPKHVGNS